MEDNKIRIVAAVVDTTQLTLYKADGETIIIPQGDVRLRAVLEEATPQLIELGYADVLKGTLSAQQNNDFLQFEQKSNGVVKLFRVAKSALAALFGSGMVEEVVDTVAPTALGTVPVPASGDSDQLTKTKDAVAEIMAHAVPVSSPDYHEERVHQQNNIVEDGNITPDAHPELDKSSDTVIAVVGGKVIPGMELIKTQFGRAAKASTVGLENFLKRIGAVIHERSHSVEDLLKFLERGDLPIADDGSILIYKILRRRGKHYVDCHSGKVEQWVGAYVHMDVRLVDHDRRNECSNGLHVARRGYINSFSGDVCVLAKLAPEDVIAVPQYDANKMRVCGYHIIRELTDKQYKLLKSNLPITDDEDGKLLLAECMAGHHVGRTHNVKITEQRGGGVETTVVLEAKKDRVPVVVAPVEALNNPDAETKDIPVDVKALSQEVGQLSRADKAKKLYEAYLDCEDGAKEALYAFKRASKVSWEKLGIPDPESVPMVVKKTSKAKDLVPKVNPNFIQNIELSEGSARERINKLMQLELNAAVAKSILNVKRQSKKSWETLGVDEAQVTVITKLLG